MSRVFWDGFAKGCIHGSALAAVIMVCACIWLGANGYTLTQHPPEPVLVPIDCKVVA